MSSAIPSTSHKRSRTERRLRSRSVLLGSLLTVLVIIVFLNGNLNWLDGKLYDARARFCQFFRKPPTDRLIHIDIDDGALETIGRWPWNRDILASVVDELSLDGAKAIGFDIILSEPQEPRLDATGAVTDYDTILAASIKHMGHVLVPASMSFESLPPDPPETAAAAGLLEKDLELNLDQVNEKLHAQAQPPVPADQFVHALRQAMTARIRHELAAGDITPDKLRANLLPIWTKSNFDASAPTVRVFTQQLLRLQSERALESFSLPMTTPLSLLHAYSAIAPLPIFADVARYSGFVDRLPETDGKVRRVPLVVEFHGRLFPQIGLVLACAALDVETSHLQFLPDKVIIPLHDGRTITVPTTSRPTRQGTVGMFMDIPWFGKGNWRTMYPGPLGQHLNIGSPYELSRWRHFLRNNNSIIDDAIKDVLSIKNDVEPLEKYKALTLSPDDFNTRLSNAQKTLADSEILDSLSMIRPVAPEQRDKAYRTAPESFDALKIAVEQNTQLQRQITQRAAQLHDLINNHVVLIGEASSASTDLVNTPLEPQVPGVVAHGAIVNAILTRQLWQEAPNYVTAIHTLAAGILATLAVAFLTHVRAAFAVAALLLAYLIFNGLILFDHGNYLVGTAAPITAVFIVWGAVNLVSVAVESAERARITHHFRTYVDPQLADYFLENPEHLHLHGELKELTVVFTDIVGFTSITERMGVRAVDILNEYLQVMIPIIRARRGLVNKFLGDGIMIIFGALWENPDHAANAVDTVLEMFKATCIFAESLKSRGLPPIRMRAGVSTGPMIVGDAGSDTARDFTVLGDAVNTAARLEQANKRLDTQLLISGGTAKHLDSRFLLRPVGNLMLAGKTESVEAFELVARRVDATPANLRLVELSDRVINYVNIGQLTDCSPYLKAIESEFGPSKFTAAYQLLLAASAPQKHIPA